MNISELARRLRANTEELREKLPMMGFDVGAKAIKIDDRLVDKIMAKWGEHKKSERLRQKYARDERIRTEAVAAVREVALPKVISVRDFAGKLSLPVNIVIGELMKNGILASLNERLDYDTASILAEDFGYQVAPEQEASADMVAQMSSEELKASIAESDETKLQGRPPVVVVMGHVDHGKTSLLDAIRTTHVASGEQGGITQHIGAYQVEKKGQKITFIDTPGHEAFTVMRSRGARVADIAVLVVAADDGVQPQTKEVIKIIEAAKLPYVVALNKMDKPDADPQRVKTQLSELGVIPEEWGGKAVLVPVSAKTGKGLDDLLETILLVAEMEKDSIRANPNRPAAGTVIEAHVDKGEGPVATVLVQSGTLRRNDELGINETLFGRVRAMKEWNGKFTEKAMPGTPVRVLGFKIAPQVGDVVQVPETAGQLKQVKRQYAMDKQSAAAPDSGNTADNPDRKTLNVILKADALGSLEAIAGTLEKYKTPEVAVKVIAKGLGNITDGDMLRAEASSGIVMGFNVRATREAEIIGRDKKIEFKIYNVIYSLFDECKRRLQDMIPAEIIKTDLGKLQVLANFRADKTGQVIGGRCIDGHIEAGANVVVFRGEEPVDEGKLITLQSGKQEVKEIRAGQECGLKVSCRRPILVNDEVRFFTVERRERKLDLKV
jgi:translation initiation factor IF-2